MDINMKIEVVRDIVEHFLEKMEGKLDDVGISMDSSDMDAVTDMLLGIVENDLLS